MSRLYFAYGSNMKRSRLEGERIGAVIDHGIATLQNYTIAFNKQSTDGTGKTNIMPAEQKETIGVLYEMTEDQLKKLDEIEKGYYRILIHVEWRGEIKHVQTYVAVEQRINNGLLPTAEYLGHLIKGASDHGFPEEYQTFLKSFEVRK
jgi:gamma-glutamylcyclotransferase